MKIAFGSLVNDLVRLDMCLRQSEVDGQIYTIKMPENATTGLNKLLDIIKAEGNDIAVLAHQDMFFRQGWLPQLKEQLKKLPDSWMVAGIIGKDMAGKMCGMLHDMRIPLHFNSAEHHKFPQPASCFDECCIIINLKSGFRFDETLKGFDLYGTLCCLQTEELGGTAWVLDCFAEHYCTRPFSWYPDDEFGQNFKWLHQRFPNARRIDTTVIGTQQQLRR